MAKIKQESIFKAHFALVSAKHDPVADVVKGTGTVVGSQSATQIQKVIRLVQECQRNDPYFRFSERTLCFAHANP